MNKLTRLFENLLMSSRVIIVIAVIFGLLSAIAMVILGSFDIVTALIKTVQLFFNTAQFDVFEKLIVTKIISAVDNYLIATVLLIFSIGLYELFINKIEAKGDKGTVLVIKDLDQLKENLAKVIIIVLIVTYFKYALEMSYEHMVDLFFLSGGVFLIALSVYFIRQK